LNEAPSTREAARRYDLFLREDRKRFFLRYKDQGVTLNASEIAWTAGGMERKKSFDDIFSIHLQSANVGQSPTIYTCVIEFRDGQQLLVTSASEYGSGWEEQSKLYGEFVRDLHARIPQIARGEIEFRAGNTEGKQKFLWATLVVAVLFFVATPVILLLITGDMQALWITLAGAGMVYPLIRSAKANEPRNYRCEYLPDDLVPA
jgi:hypothetical protein